MLKHLIIAAAAGLAAQAGVALADEPFTAAYAPGEAEYGVDGQPRARVQLGSRPGYLVDAMSDGPLRDRLASCVNKRPRKTDFSIGHRGAPLMFPEHTRESYIAAANQGAGIMECDVTFTADRELVCRHSQCDLHTTTNILATPLAKKCTQDFVPADPDAGTSASALCCTSDITLDEYRTLTGKMDAADPNATTVEEYLGGTADFRTDLYATGGTLLTHAESIELFKALGVKMTPELKAPSVEMPYQGDYTQEDYAQQMIDEYKAANVRPGIVWAQSFNYDDVLYWINNEPRFGRQAVFLDSRPYSDPDFVPSSDDFAARRADGLNIIAPPMFALLTSNADGDIVPSPYAELASEEGLDFITWTIERSGRIREDVLEGGGSFYYQTTLDAVENDGDIYTTLHALTFDVGIIGIFSDWPATVTYYANCMGL
ncbi:MAG: glycerophosphodiester phosphodiesterase family protein [Pseudomonadota bacterium]